MKQLIYFLPYALTNVGFMLFFVIGLFLLSDAIRYQNLEEPLYLYGKLFVFLLLFSVPKFLLKGVIPELFQKGNKQGFWWLAKNTVITAILFFLFTLAKKMECDDVAFFYRWFMWISFFFTIYCHYFWGIALKKQNHNSERVIVLRFGGLSCFCHRSQFCRWH